ncbi:hypothetical protein FH972_003589 [Carpinus fangiana]|uniref:Uncharacterized protein n=1 Tax=Carpinus fangiana TaxID=176857 RepID=A0A5N6QIM6_9ROSI|nr:hypothetical protein FH972_003589 [Carpinus fangiana]
MAAVLSFMSNFERKFPLLMDNHSQIQEAMFYFCFLVFFFTTFLFVFLSSAYRRLKTAKQKQEEEHTLKPIQSDPSRLERSSVETVSKTHETSEKDPTHLAHSLLLEVLPSDSQKWECLFDEGKSCDPDSNGSGLDREGLGSGGDQRVKKKKKRAKKKKLNLQAEEGRGERENSGTGSRAMQDLVCLYPFTSSSSAMQRRIKQQYEELVKCNETKRLTMAQVGEFDNCLIKAINELQRKADGIQRKFTIKKALLFKADRSSFDRLRQQIYKLELEKQRLEEDAFVYNLLQQQLKLFPAYKKMLEFSASMELKAKSGELMDNTDTEFSDISFEELLAQEKKDSFWQRKSRSCSG